MVQWIRIHLPVQGTWVRPLVQDYPTCHRATEPVHHRYQAQVLQPPSPRTQSVCSPTREATAVRSPSARMNSSLNSLQLDKAQQSNEDPAQPEVNLKKKNKLFPREISHSQWKYFVSKEQLFYSPVIHYQPHAINTVDSIKKTEVLLTFIVCSF